MPAKEFDGHWNFWKNFRWGMENELQAIAITNQIRSVAPKSNVEPWMVLGWTVQADYAYKIKQVVMKPVSAIRSGFFAIFNAISGMKK